MVWGPQAAGGWWADALMDQNIDFRGTMQLLASTLKAPDSKTGCRSKLMVIFKLIMAAETSRQRMVMGAIKLMRCCKPLTPASTT